MNKNKKQRKFFNMSLAGLTVVTLALVGCSKGGGGGSSATPPPPPQPKLHIRPEMHLKPYTADGVAAADYSKAIPTQIPGYFSVTLYNETKGNYPNKQIHVQFLARNPVDGNIVTWKLSGAQTAEGYPLVSIYEPYVSGVAVPFPSLTLADLKNGTFYVPAESLDAARLYVSLGNSVQALQTYPNDPTQYAQPAFNVNTGLDVNTPFDWLEFGYDPSNAIQYIYNITQVDMFSVPLWYKVTDVQNIKNPITGFVLRDTTYSPALLPSRDSIMSGYQNFADHTAFSLANLQQGTIAGTSSPARILSPVYEMANFESVNYFDSSFNSFWSTYASSASLPNFRMCTNDPGSGSSNREVGDCYKGFVDGSGNFNFWHYLPGNVPDSGSDCPGTSAAPYGAYCVIQNPVVTLPIDKEKPSQCALNGDCFSQGSAGTWQKAFNTQIMSAVNRGIAGISYDASTGYTQWNNPLTFYPKSTPSNLYSKYWHTIAPGNRAYGYSYDDAGEQSSAYAPKNQVANIAIGIGW